MKDAKSKWLVYTLFVGLIPALMRLLIFGIAVDGQVAPFFWGDFIKFCLVLQNSLIIESEMLYLQGLPRSRLCKMV